MSEMFEMDAVRVYVGGSTMVTGGVHYVGGSTKVRLRGGGAR